MKTIAIIPARGGSKRIPRKNIKPFLGKPMIAYAIDAAKKSELFDRIIVSTDSEEIADVAKIYDAEIPFMRPRELSDDFTGTHAVTKHAVEWLKEHGEDMKYICCIYATVPLIRVDYLKRGYQLLAEGRSTHAFAVTTFGFPIQRALKLNRKGCVEFFHPEHALTRSQDLETAYHDAGQFYWGLADIYLGKNESHKSESMPVLLPRHLVQDIDTEEDWQRAEIMYRVLAEKGEMPPIKN